LLLFRTRESIIIELFCRRRRRREEEEEEEEFYLSLLFGTMMRLR